MPPQIRNQSDFINALQGLTGNVTLNAANPVRTQGFAPGEVRLSNPQGQAIPYTNANVTNPVQNTVSRVQGQPMANANSVQNTNAPVALTQQSQRSQPAFNNAPNNLSQLQPGNYGNSAINPAQIISEPKKGFWQKLGEGVRDTFVGSPGKNISLPTMTQEQYDTLRQFIPQLMQLQQSNQPSSLLQQLLGQPSQFQLPQDRFQNPMEGFEPIRQRAITEFNTKTVPSLAERFTAMGAGGQRSSAFQGALGSAGAGLQEALAALASQYGLQREQLGANYDLNRAGLASHNDLARASLGLNQYQGNQTQIVNLLRTLLQNPFENIYQRGQPGLLVAGAQGLGEGFGRAAGAYLGGGLV